MDDIFKPIDPNALNELASEETPPAPPQPANQSPNLSAQPANRPMGRHMFHSPDRSPAFRTPSPQPAQTMPTATPPQINMAQAAAPPISTPMPGFQQPQPVPQAAPAPSPNAPMPVGVSASSLGLNSKTQPKLPKGIYIIVGLTAIDLFIAFVSSNTSVAYSVAVVVDLLLAVGLLTKINLARQATTVFQIINVLLVILVIIGLMATESRLNQLSGQYNDAVAKASAHSTPQQEVAIDDLNTQMNQQRRQIGKAIGIDYVRSSVSILVSGGIIWYLTRPGVKAAFH